VTATELRQERNRAAYELEDDRDALATLRVQLSFARGEVRRRLVAEIAGVERRIAWLAGKVAA
jgi:hypothetical protein